MVALVGIAQAATVTYDFNSGLGGTTDGSLMVGDLSFTHGNNSEANVNRNAQRAWYSEDSSGDDMFYISGRSSDNKGTSDANLDMTLGNPSYASFILTPATGESFNFSSGTLNLNAIIYDDATASFDMGYKLWVDIGSGWTALGAAQVVSGSGGASGSGTIYEVNESTILTLGNGMTTGTIAATPTTLNFDLSSLGILSMDQSVNFAVALSGTRDNHASFNSGMDDIVVTVAEDSSGNTLPVAADDAYGMLEEGVLTVSAPGVLDNDSDADSDPLTAIEVTSPGNGLLALSSDGSFTYTPDTDFAGVDSFTYSAHDGTSAGVAATVSITVTNTPDAPEATADSYVMVSGASLNVSAPGVLGNDSDPDGDAITAIKVSDPAHGSVVLTSSGAFVYTPNAGYLGADSFTYKVNDGSVDGNTVAVSISINESVLGTKPNILLFFADDMGWGDLQTYNPNCPVDLPTIELLAQQGMRFTDAHTPQALCAPNRYSILSGNYVWRGRSGWDFGPNGSVLEPGQESIAQMLKKAGYHTAMVGKGHIGGTMPELPANTLFSPANAASIHPKGVAGVAIQYDWNQRLSGGANDIGFDYSFMCYGGIQGDPFVFHENDWLWGDPADILHLDGAGGGYTTTNGVSVIEGSDSGDGMPYWHSCNVGPTLTQKTLEFIDGHHQSNLVNGTSTPFFIHYCAEAVHVPHTPPKDFLGTPVEGTTQVPWSKTTNGYQYSPHSDLLFELDVALGMMLDALETRGLLENTLIIFTSDNGGLKDAVTGTSFSNDGLNGYKSTPWEGGHRVPFIVKWGDGSAEGSHIPPNTVRDQMINIMDIYTTLAEIAGVDVAADQAMDSVSLRSIWLEGNTNQLRQVMQGFGGGQYVLRDGDWKYHQDGGSGKPARLFDLGSDLDETNDLISNPAQASRVSTMEAQLNTILAYDNTTNRTTVVPPPVPDPSIKTDADLDGMEDSWERSHFASISGYNGGALDDIDKDGLVNLFEYAVGGHPTAGADGDSILPKIQTVGSGVKFVYNRRTNAAALNLQYTLEHTDNLLSNVWTTGGYVETDTGVLANGLESVTNTIDTAGKTNQFIRLKVVAP
jgi:arylsulfatase A-like enzyme